MAPATAIMSPKRCCRESLIAAGAIGRVPAAEIEALISAAVRRHLQANGTDAVDSDRELVERHVERATLTRKHIHLRLRQYRRCTGTAPMPTRTQAVPSRDSCTARQRHDPLEQPGAGWREGHHPCARLTTPR